MKKRIKQLVAGLSLAVAATAASAVTVSTSITADNDFVVLLTQGNAHTEVLRSSDGREWRRAQHAKFEISPRQLEKCSIDIIAWDDHAVKQGVLARIGGNGGTVLTGQPAMKAFATKVANNATWANTGYPNAALINQIYASLIPAGTAVHGNNGVAPWGNIAGIPAAAKWIWADSALYGRPYAGNFTVYRTPCSKVVKGETPRKKGLTWRKIGSDPITGTVDVGCGYSNGANECNPYHGDQFCSTALPVLCKLKVGSQKPLSTTVNARHRWVQQLVHTTRPVRGDTFAHLQDVNDFCVREFGSGWQVASHHDNPRGWYFKAYGNTGTQVKRFWVDIKDQPDGTCWAR